MSPMRSIPHDRFQPTPVGLMKAGVCERSEHMRASKNSGKNFMMRSFMTSHRTSNMPTRVQSTKPHEVLRRVV